MANFFRKHYLTLGLWLALTAYFWLSGSLVQVFPYVHSDEAWLSGLSRAMVEEGRPDVTESFFNLKPRWPHGLKILFHGLQIIALHLGGYEIATFRLLSLAAAFPTLLLFYGAAIRLFAGRREPALLATALLGLDVQFIYASHMARQEIFLLLALCGCLYALLGQGPIRYRQVLACALLCGLAVGFHPNAFLLACCCGAALLARACYRQLRLGQLALYIGLTGALAALFVGLSLVFDPHFISHYAAYGAREFGLNLSLSARLQELPLFWHKLYQGISGTYYLPELRPQLYLFPGLGLLLLAYVLVMSREQPEECAQAATLLAGGLGLIAGIMLIGRYNQLSLVFLCPLGWLIVVRALDLWGQGLRRFCWGLLLLVIIGCSWYSIKPWLKTDYQAYLEHFQQQIEPGALTLGNLNSEYAFAYGQLLDYRNLAYLDEQGLDIESYVRQYAIEYIVYSGELDFIQANRPYWNIIYGNIDIAALRDFLDNSCEVVYEFEDAIYGPRIVELVGNPEYGKITIYKVK